MLSYISPTLSFLISFTLYLFTLAPAVTFEDSGELITAAYSLGIPHEPGYPLFTMIGHLFTWIPFGSVAWRVNLMSAVFSALGAALITSFTISLIEVAFVQKSRQPSKKVANPKSELDPQKSKILKYVSALAAGIFSATALTNWSQSIITEVYGLHAFFVGLVLVLTIRWYQASDENKRQSYFFSICFTVGLAFTNHPTTLLLLAVLVVFAFLVDKEFLLNPKRFLKGTAIFVAGLLPFAYLPIASGFDPVMDWGNPETLDNFLAVITRQQYRRESWSSFEKFIPQIKYSAELLMRQWPPVLLVAGLVGLAVLFNRSRHFFYFFLLFILFTMPVTTVLTDFDVAGENAIINAQNKDIATVFYIPAYQAFAALIGLGLYWIFSCTWANRIHLPLAAAMICLLPSWPIYTNYKKVDKSRYYFAEDYIHNLFSVVKENSLVITNWDPFIFTLNYAQFVEGRRPDVIVIDQELISTSWYLEWALHRHPQLFEGYEDVVRHFLAELREFEAGDRKKKSSLVDEFKNLMNKIIDRSKISGREVYLTFDPPEGVAEKYFKESVIAAVRLDTQIGFQKIPLDRLTFRNFFDPDIPLDPMAKFFKGYYGKLFFARGYILEATKDYASALEMYKRSIEFLSSYPDLAQQSRVSIQRLEKKTPR